MSNRIEYEIEQICSKNQKNEFYNTISRLYDSEKKFDYLENKITSIKKFYDNGIVNSIFKRNTNKNDLTIGKIIKLLDSSLILKIRYVQDLIKIQLDICQDNINKINEILIKLNDLIDKRNKNNKPITKLQNAIDEINEINKKTKNTINSYKDLVYGLYDMEKDVYDLSKKYGIENLTGAINNVSVDYVNHVINNGFLKIENNIKTLYEEFYKNKYFDNIINDISYNIKNSLDKNKNFTYKLSKIVKFDKDDIDDIMKNEIRIKSLDYKCDNKGSILVKDKFVFTWSDHKYNAAKEFLENVISHGSSIKVKYNDKKCIINVEYTSPILIQYIYNSIFEIIKCYIDSNPKIKQTYTISYHNLDSPKAFINFELLH